jgi:D-alanyl-D-alanine carboxypeptidase
MSQLREVVAAYIAKNKISHITPGLGFQYGIGDRIEEELYVGVADYAQGQPLLSRDSCFQICSITKVFVGLLLLKLEQEKLLDFEATLGSFFGEAPPGIHNITLKELVGHTSGLFDYLTIENSDLGSDWQSDKALAFIWSLNSEAGTSRGTYKYCNSGFMLLGEIVQKITGKPWFETLREKVLEPLGTKDTYSIQNHPHPETIVKSHEGGYGEWKIVKPSPYQVGWAEGNLISSFGDLRKLCLAFESDILFDKSYLKEKLSHRSVIVPGETFYSWGIQIIEKPDRTWLMHGGGSEGVHTLWIYCPQTKEQVFTFANHMMLSHEDPRNSLNHTLIDFLGFKF